MARHRRIPAPEQPVAQPQTGLRWETLVQTFAPYAQRRKGLMVWQWRFNRGDIVQLVPYKGATIGVIGVVLEPTAPTPNNEHMTDVPCVRLQLYWRDGDVRTAEATLPNVMALRHVYTADRDRLLSGAPLTDADWDFTKRTPDAPDVLRSGPALRTTDYDVAPEPHRANPAPVAPVVPASPPAPAIADRGKQRGWNF